MVNRAKAKGSLFERDVAAYLGLKRAYPIMSYGDILGPDFIIECKNCAKFDLPAWLRQAEASKVRASKRFAFVVAKRRTLDVGSSYVVCSLSTFRDLVLPQN